MTEKQEAFIRRLIDERHVEPDMLDRLTTTLDAGVDKAQASRIIDWLTAQPFKARAEGQPGGLDLTDVPTGRYAVGDVLFKVDNLTGETNAIEAGVNRQKWAGWVFVKDGSEYHGDVRFGSQRPGGTYRGTHDDLLVVVAENPTAAAQRYGQVTGRCGVCNRTLEDDVSVARGIGPVCWERVA